MKKIFFLFLYFLFFAVGFTYVHAADITDDCFLSVDGQAVSSKLTDKSVLTYVNFPSGAKIHIQADETIGGFYIRFDKLYGEWKLSEGGIASVYGRNGFLHEYADIDSLFGENTSSLLLTFDNNVSIGEISVFSIGELPAWVQRWEKPSGSADLLLLSTHSDDEHLFFAGILPDAVSRKFSVQVVYLTNHFDTRERPHEQLDGLWAAGVTRYPIIGPFADKYAESITEAEEIYKTRTGNTREDFIAFQVEMIRRFRPQVIAAHDIKGEYGHGVHMLNTSTLMEALDYTHDETKFPESSVLYGAYDVPKVYIHLYKENPIELDIDKPLNFFGGRTAFNVSQDAFRHHKSQHWTGFYTWLYGSASAPVIKSTQITRNNPRLFGLYKTTVGPDLAKNDLFENIVSYTRP